LLAFRVARLRTADRQTVDAGTLRTSARRSVNPNIVASSASRSDPVIEQSAPMPSGRWHPHRTSVSRDQGCSRWWPQPSSLYRSMIAAMRGSLLSGEFAGSDTNMTRICRCALARSVRRPGGLLRHPHCATARALRARHALAPRASPASPARPSPSRGPSPRTAKADIRAGQSRRAAPGFARILSAKQPHGLVR
jgi:hypothetical protein